MASQSYHLVMRVGPSPGKIYELTEEEVVLGRDIGNEIVINDAEISRRHTRLSMQEDGYVVEDLGSTNGTFVNGEKISGSTVLQPGQTIRMGENITLSYEIAGFDPDATIASGPSKTPAAQPAKPAKPRAAQPAAAMEAPSSADAPAGKNAQGKLAGNRNILIGCGVLLLLGICVFSIFLYTAPESFYCNFLGFLFSAC